VREIGVGQRFGRLVASEPRERRKGFTYVQCRCDCGGIAAIRWVRSDRLIHGRTKSCGCLRRERSADRRRAAAGKSRATIRGEPTRVSRLVEWQRYGSLIAICALPEPEQCASRRRWLCQCKCGNYILVRADRLAANPLDDAELAAIRDEHKYARLEGLDPPKRRKGRSTCGCGKVRYATQMLQAAQRFADRAEYELREVARESSELEAKHADLIPAGGMLGLFPKT
jgi:hypothetical protein